MKKHLYIKGEWIEATEYRPLHSPYDAKEIAEIAYANEEEVNMAIVAAEETKGTMRKMPLHERAAILERLSDLIEENKEECAQLIAKESAKPIKTARGEVARTITTYKFAAEEAKRIQGEAIPMDAAPGGEHRVAYTVREPLGVIAAITPFNFPMNLVAHKVGPAIAAGNTIVLKPASQTPLSSLFLAELLEKAGLPKGAFNIVTGSGRTVGSQLVEDERVKAVTFTGSPEVGTQIRKMAGLKKVTLELGSNSALIVDKDTDLDEVMDRIVTGAFSFSGQVCISIQRIYVHEDISETFVNKLAEKTEQLKLGDPLSEDTDLSSLISEEDVERVLTWIKEAVEQGAKLITGGKLEGTIVEPTILTNVDTSSKVSCQEAFAPLVIVNSFKTLKDALKMVNDSDYGLQAGIYTKDINRALEAADELEVGGVLINDIPTFRVDHMPYGGVKKSGMGREGLKYAIEEMTEIKLISIKR